MEQKSRKIFISSDPVLGAPGWEVGIIIIIPALRGKKWNLSDVNQLSLAQTTTGGRHSL